MTSASTLSSRSTGSRSGPAGRQRPLPKPRSSITTSSIEACQSDVLQAVVADQDVAIRMPTTQRRGRGGAVLADRERHAGLDGEQQRLVADRRCVARGVDQRHRVGGSGSLDRRRLRAR